MEEACAIYVRLSKEDEIKPQAESESIQNQKALLTRYAAQQGWPVQGIYCDEDRSGADRTRPAFNALLEEARRGQVQIVLCKSQSRFTRDMELVEKYIHGLFPLWGVRFVAVADHIDTALRGNKKARQINGLVNQWYLEDLSENVRMVLELKRREGQYLGASPLYGYRKDPADRHHLLPDPEAAAVVAQIFSWALEGVGKEAIARRLNRQGVLSPAWYKGERGLGPPQKGDSLWTKTAVCRILRNEMYTGTLVQGRTCRVSYKSEQTIPIPRERWQRVEGTHQPIVDRETFQAVQRLLDSRVRSDGRGEVHPLAGLVRCLDCGCSMTKTANGRSGVFYLRCGGYARGTGCSRHAIRLDALLDRVAGELGEPVTREAALARLDRVEVGEKDRETGAQEVRIRRRVSPQNNRPCGGA